MISSRNAKLSAVGYNLTCFLDSVCNYASAFSPSAICAACVLIDNSAGTVLHFEPCLFRSSCFTAPSPSAPLSTPPLFSSSTLQTTSPSPSHVQCANRMNFLSPVSSSQRDVLCKNLHRNIFFPLSGFLCGHFINRTTASLPNCQSLTLLPPPTDRIRCGEKPQRTKKRVMTKIHQSAWPREREVASAAPLATAFTHEKDQTQCVLARQLACSSQTIVCKSFTWQRPKMQDDARQNCSVKNRVPRNGHEAPRVKNKTMLFVAL